MNEKRIKNMGNIGISIVLCCVMVAGACTIVVQAATMPPVSAGWTEQTSHVSAYLKAVTFFDANNGWAVGQNGTIIHTSNGGVTWVNQTSNAGGYILWSVTAVDANTAWAVGDAGTIVNTTDGGTTWSTQTSSVSGSIFGVCAVDTSHIWACGSDGIIGSSNGGSTWASQETGLGYTLSSIIVVNGPLGLQFGWAVGEGGHILNSVNARSHRWTAQTSGTNYWLNSITFSLGNATAWAVGNNGCILYDRAFKGWQNLTSASSTTTDLLSVSTSGIGSNVADVYAVGLGGTIVYSHLGTTFTHQTGAVSTDLAGVCFITNLTGWAVGYGGKIETTSTGGGVPELAALAAPMIAMVVLVIVFRKKKE